MHQNAALCVNGLDRKFWRQMTMQEDKCFLFFLCTNIYLISVAQNAFGDKSFNIFIKINGP